MKELTFAQRMKLVREMSMLTQAEVAQRSGLQPSAVSHFESGEREPSVANLRRICIAMKCSADLLLGLKQ